MSVESVTKCDVCNTEIPATQRVWNLVTDRGTYDLCDAACVTVIGNTLVKRAKQEEKARREEEEKRDEEEA